MELALCCTKVTWKDPYLGYSTCVDAFGVRSMSPILCTREDAFGVRSAQLVHSMGLIDLTPKKEKAEEDDEEDEATGV